MIRRAIGRARTPALVAAGLVVAHDAIFAADSGLASLGSALSGSGHGTVWALISLLALLGGTVAAVAVIARLLRYEAEVRALHAQAERGGVALGSDVARTASAAAVIAELRRLWPRLFVGILLGFLVQENLEAFAGQAAGGGLAPILSVHPLAIPVLLGVSLFFATVGALVRRRTRELERRVRALRTQLARLPRATGRLSGRRPIPGGLLLREAILLLPQEGRAPPSHAAFFRA